jgi:hypothetical protein
MKNKELTQEEKDRIESVVLASKERIIKGTPLLPSVEPIGFLNRDRA